MLNEKQLSYFEARKWASLRIKNSKDLDMYAVDFLLEKLFDLSSTELLINYQTTMPVNQWQQFQSAIDQLLNGVPPQYITGKADFYGLVMKVTPDVLIPRVETEELVDWILTENPPTRLSVLDIGTGSGAIAIALKKQRPEWEVTASDISEAAIDIARQNAQANRTQIHFVVSDIFDNLDDSYDIIVSNPPYIANDEKKDMDQSVIDNEPDLALYAEDQGLAIYKRIAAGACEHLNSPGKMFLEIGFHQENSVTQIFQGALPKAQVISKHDVSEHQRMIQVKK